MTKYNISFCVDDYNILSEDHSNYSFGWSEYVSNFTPEYTLDRVYKAFQYRTASDLNGYPVVGEYNTYWGGGYVYEMRGQKSYLVGNLTILQNNSWIDRQTRAIIIEFAVFNPNINLISSAEIVVEILPTGAIVTSSRFDPIYLFDKLTWSTIIVYVLYILFVIYFTFDEIKEMAKEGKKYFLQFWNYVEWSVIGFSWAAFALFIYKLNASAEVSNFFKTTSGYGYFKFQNIVLWNLFLNYSLAYCISLSTLKFLKIFRFDKQMSYLGSTLKYCAEELIALGFTAVIILVSFMQLFYFIFQNQVAYFSSLSKSMTTCFQIILGKFSVDLLLESDSTLGPIIYILFNIMMVFIILTLFISIMNDAFKVVRERDNNDYHLMNSIRKKMKQITKVKISKANKTNEFISNDYSTEYKDQLDYLPEKVNSLLQFINEVTKKIL